MATGSGSHFLHSSYQTYFTEIVKYPFTITFHTWSRNWKVFFLLGWVEDTRMLFLLKKMVSGRWFDQVWAPPKMKSVQFSLRNKWNSITSLFSHINVISRQNFIHFNYIVIYCYILKFWKLFSSEESQFDCVEYFDRAATLDLDTTNRSRSCTSTATTPTRPVFRAARRWPHIPLGSPRHRRLTTRAC